jgi:hypothetical protein
VVTHALLDKFQLALHLLPFELGSIDTYQAETTGVRSDGLAVLDERWKHLQVLSLVAVKAEEHAVAVFDVRPADTAEFNVVFADVLRHTLENVKNLKF